MSPMKLSLCGATALTHDAVSALLRLPILTELDIGGCCRITAMDKMRLVAKVGAANQRRVERDRQRERGVLKVARCTTIIIPRFIPHSCYGALC